jgi:hypothetical protein
VEATKTKPSRRILLWVSGIAAVALLVVLGVLDEEMRDAGGPGIVKFEYAATPERVDEILGEWGTDGHDAARLSLWIDYPFMLAYGAFFALAISALRDSAGRRGWQTTAWAGAIAVWLPVLAALFDAAENVGLLLALGGHGRAAAPLLGTVYASLKFLAIGLAALYMLGWLARLGYQRLRPGA